MLQLFLEEFQERFEGTVFRKTHFRMARSERNQPDFQVENLTCKIKLIPQTIGQIFESFASAWNSCKNGAKIWPRKC